MAQTQSPFQNVPLAPPDPILGVTDAFNADQNPKKVNLGVGVYQDGQGKIPVLRTVHEAEKRWLELETSEPFELPAAGQFVQLLLDFPSPVLLPRPMSVAAAPQRMQRR